MDDNKYKDLDQFFRSRLNNAEPSSNHWNVPSDDILNNALDQLGDDKEDKKRYYFLYVIIGILLLSLVGMGIYGNKKVDELNQQIIELHKKQDKKETDKNQTNNTPLVDTEKIDNTVRETVDMRTEYTGDSKVPDTSTPGAYISNVSQKIPNTDQSNFANKSKNTSALSTNKEIINISNDVQNIPSVDKKNDIIPVETTSLILADQDNAIDHLNPLKSLPIQGLNVAKRKMTLKMEDIVEEDEKRSTLSHYVSFGHLLSTFKMTNVGSVDYSLTKYDQYYSGWQFGVGMNYALSDKTFLSADLKYSRVVNESLFSDQMNYDKSNEFLNDDGDIIYNSMVSVESPTGRFAQELNVELEDQELEDGETFNNEANISERFEIIHLGLSINRQIWKAGRFTLGISGSMGANRLLDWSQKIDVNLMLDNVKMANHEYASNNKNQLNNYFFNAGIGLNMRQDFSNNLFLQFQTGIERSLTSLRKTTTGTEPKTYLNGFRSGLSLGYHF